jgi:hypothetical protein
MYARPMPVTAWSKAWVFDRSLACIVGSNPAEAMDVCHELKLFPLFYFHL